jgi:hypothetical protein
MSEAGEVWKFIPRYNNRYLASSKGRVLSLCRDPQLLVLTSSEGTGEYLVVSLGSSSPDGKQKVRKVHQVIAETFLDNPLYLPLVRHKDGNQKNNNLENLAWGTYKENSADSEAHGTRLRGEAIGLSKLTQLEVVDIRDKYASGKYLMTELATLYGVYRTTIGDVINRRTWTWL